MKIKEMSDTELNESIDYCMAVPVEDPMYSGWNFDREELLDKLTELLDEREIRGCRVEEKIHLNTELSKPHNRDLLTGV